jgi:hypothetical protein
VATASKSPPEVFLLLTFLALLAGALYVLL